MTRARCVLGGAAGWPSASRRCVLPSSAPNATGRGCATRDRFHAQARCQRTQFVVMASTSSTAPVPWWTLSLQCSSTVAVARLPPLTVLDNVGNIGLLERAQTCGLLPRPWGMPPRTDTVSCASATPGTT